jgi:hypothetical protein
MIMFLVGTRETDNLGQQQGIASRAQDLGRCLTPWYFYVESSNYVFHKCCMFLSLSLCVCACVCVCVDASGTSYMCVCVCVCVDVNGTSYYVMELVSENG